MAALILEKKSRQSQGKDNLLSQVPGHQPTKDWEQGSKHSLIIRWLGEVVTFYRLYSELLF